MERTENSRLRRTLTIAQTEFQRQRNCSTVKATEADSNLTQVIAIIKRVWFFNGSQCMLINKLKEIRARKLTTIN